MDHRPAPTANSSRRRLVQFWPWLIVLLVLLFVGFIRVRLLDMPLERDEGEYAYAGQLILQGIPPYELAYNMKLPGTYFAYAVGMAFFGQTIAGVHLTLAVVNSLAIIFVFLLGRKLFGVTAGLVACASYGVMAVSPAVLGMAAHANHFVVLFALPATLLLWKADESSRLGTLFFSGLLYGLAFLMKQQGICFCFFGWVVFVWRVVQKRPLARLDFVKNGFIFGLGMILPFGLTCIYLALAGVFSKFWFWAFTYAGTYVTSPSPEIGWVGLVKHLKNASNPSVGFWILAVTGLPLALRNKAIRRQTAFAVFFWISSFLGTAAGFYFRPHYFILILPAFAIITGLAVDSWRQVLHDWAAKIVPLVLFITILGWDILFRKDLFFQLPPDRVIQTTYGSNVFAESLIIAGYVHDHSSQDDRLAVIGSEPEIYFYAQRHSATGYIYTYALMEPQSYAMTMQQEMIREIESARPEYMVLIADTSSWLAIPSSDRTVLRWFEQYSKQFYEVVGVVGTRPANEMFCLWNDDAKVFSGSVKQYVALYRRNPPSKTVHVRTN